MAGGQARPTGGSFVKDAPCLAPESCLRAPGRLTPSAPPCSPVLVGLLGAVEVVPLVIFGLYGGVLADRLDRRRLAVWTEAGLGLTAVALTVNAAGPRPLLWPLYACAAATMALAALQRPSLDAAVPRLLPEDRLASGSALLSLGASTGAIAGPAIGGVLAAGPGPATAYGLDAVSFGVSVALLLRLRPLPRPTDQDQADQEQARVPRLSGILAGLRYARGRPDLLGSYLADLADLAAMLLAYGLACVAAVGLTCLTLPGFRTQDAKAPTIQNRGR